PGPEVDDFHEAVGVADPQLLGAFLLIVIPRRPDHHDSVSRGMHRQGIQEFQASRVDHIDMRGHWGRSGGIASIRQIVPARLRIDPTDVEAIAESRDRNRCDQLVWAELLAVLRVDNGKHGKCPDDRPRQYESSLLLHRACLLSDPDFIAPFSRRLDSPRHDRRYYTRHTRISTSFGGYESGR